MNTDFRISIGLMSHPKTIKLIRRCGDGALMCLLRIWGWAAQFRPEGDFSGMDEEDVEIAAGWGGEAGAFVSQLVSIGFLDGDSGTYSLHDWADHNPWVAGASARSESASKAGKASAAKRASNSTDVQRDSNGRSTDVQREVNGTPTPSPSPSPSPTTPPPACAREDEIVEPDQSDLFAMTTDWQPSKFFPTLANTAGVAPPTGEELEIAIREFVPFWLTQKRRCTAHEWDLAFIKAIKSGFANPKEMSRSRSRPQSLSPRQQYMQDVGNLLEEIDGIATEGRPTRLGEAVESLPGIRPQLEHVGKIGV